MKRALWTIAVVALVVSPVLAGNPIDERVAVEPDGVVVIDNLAGSVRVTGWDSAEVWVTGTLGRGADGVEVSTTGRRATVEVQLPRDGRGRRDIDGSDLEVRIPRGCELRVETVSADILVMELEGRLQLESVSGDIEVNARPSSLEASSVSGDVEVDEAGRGAELESVSGSIIVRQAEGSLEASSVSGGIKILGGSLESAELSTTSGSIRCEAEPVGNGSIEMETMSGSVVLIVPASVSGDFELSTFSGSIRNDIGPAPERTSRYSPGEEVHFSTGSGGPRVSMQSFSGVVKLISR